MSDDAEGLLLTLVNEEAGGELARGNAEHLQELRWFEVVD